MGRSEVHAPADRSDDGTSAGYWAWNRAIAEHFFGPHNSQKPVYLDIEDQALEACAVAVGHTGDPEEDFLAAVRPTLGKGIRLLNWHKHQLEKWQRAGREAAPPFIALLALASYAAECMQHRDDVRATNYYVPFFELVGVADDYHRSRAPWQNGYREHVLDLWHGLNRWLDDHEGELGLPTARSRGQNKYVSMAISQALVREADRAHLPRFFSWVGLRPGVEVDEERMERLLAGWIPTSPLSRRLKDRWDTSAELREAFASVASTELETWDGIVGGGDNNSFNVRLVVQTSRRRPLRVMVAVEGSANRPPTDAEIGGADHTPQWEQLWPGTWVDLADPPRDALSNDIRVGGQRRASQRVNAFRLEGPRWMETRHIDRESRHLILAESTFAAVPALLDRIAPGYRQQIDPSSGWAAYHDVEVVTPLDPDDVPEPLRCLTPLTKEAVVLRGGLRYPGKPTRWHPSSPPEVVVTRTDDSPFDVSISGGGQDRIVAHGRGTALYTLGEFDPIASLDYTVSVSPGGKQLRVPTRTAGQPALAYEADPPPSLCRCTAGGPARAIWAHAVEPDCPRPHAPSGSPAPTVELPDRPAWDIQPESRGTQPTTGPTSALQFEGTPDPATAGLASHPPCTEEGGYCRILEPSGARKTKGSCIYCGRSKASELRMRDLLERLPSIAAHSKRDTDPDTTSANAIVDAIGHLRGGRVDRLHRWLANIGLDGLRRHALLADLQALGYLEQTAEGQKQLWHVKSTGLVPHPTVEGRWLVTGLQAPAAMHDVDQWVTSEGGTFTEGRTAAYHTTPGLPIRTIDGIPTEGIQDVASLVGARIRPGVDQWAPGLPDVRAAATTLRTEQQLPPTRTPERYDPRQARFRPASTTTEAGLYRLEVGYARSYWWTTDPPNGCRLPDPGLGKVLAARVAGVPALAYIDGAIITPIGARLPGLYERAAVQSSFDLPIVRSGVTAYQGVDEVTATHVFGALYGKVASAE